MKPAYRASFTIRDGKLEKIIDLCRTWVRGRFQRRLDGFNEGISIMEPGRSIETASAQVDEKDYFAMRLTHIDGVIPGFLWSTDIGIVNHQEGNNSVDVVLSNGWKDGRIQPVSFELTRPAIVPRLIEMFDASADYKLSVEPKMVRRGEIDKFVGIILDKQRKLPIVYASATNADELPRINVTKMSGQIVGVAHVFYSRDRAISLAEILGKSMDCYDGAVRVYWPCTRDYFNPASHRYWSRREISEGKDVGEELFRMISGFSISGGMIRNSVESVKGLNLRKKIGELESRQDYTQLAEAYSEENDALRKEVERLRGMNDGYVANLRDLTERLGESENTLRIYRNWDEGREDLVPAFGSVEEAVETIKGRYGQRVLFAGRTRKQVRECVYKDPQQIFRALEWVATVYVNSRRTGVEGGDIRLSCKDQTGMDYVPHQSEVTMGMFDRDYFIEVDGVRVPLEMHLKKGVSKDSNSIRIAFAYDSKSERVIIGYIGKHQRNRKT